MNTILLQPNDVLFFRDGRPMNGASAGQGAAWPHPSVINHAFHAALHRADLADAHGHKHIVEESQRTKDFERGRKFGSLVTAGPYPVRHSQNSEAQWYFPRPADGVIRDREIKILLKPVATAGSASIQKPCKYGTGATLPPSKATLGNWWSQSAWQQYLTGSNGSNVDPNIDSIDDTAFSQTEHNYGIAIDNESGCVEQGKFYSAHYLRLQEDWKLGVFASAMDKKQGNAEEKHDLIGKLFASRQDHYQIVTGGQQRVCSADVLTGDSISFPRGLRDQFTEANGKYLVKWILLSPALWPKMTGGKAKRTNGAEVKGHCGGWLPNWIDQDTGKVLLQQVSREERKRRRKQNYRGEGYQSQSDIDAHLVAAVVPKPIPITGFALPHSEAGREKGGAKPTQLAVPAGAVYYFEADSVAAATKLADTLNWHANGQFNTIKNRRSTLLGEKGFGIGVCGTWQYHH